MIIELCIKIKNIELKLELQEIRKCFGNLVNRLLFLNEDADKVQSSTKTIVS